MKKKEGKVLAKVSINNGWKEEPKNCYVAFIDVVGFSNIINDDDGVKIKSYLQIIDQWGKFAKKWKKAGDTIGFKSISDSIIIYIEYDEPVGGSLNVPMNHSLKTLIYLVSKLQLLFFQNEILTRGAISFGEITEHTKTNSILGKGIINAYQLEKLASVPRVIIDPKLIYENGKHSGIFQRKFGNLEYAIDKIKYTTISQNSHKSEGPIFKALSINYASDFLIQILKKNKDQLKTVSKCYDFIAKGVYNNPTHAEKYRWLSKHLYDGYKETLDNKIFDKLKPKDDLQIRAFFQAFGNF